MSHYTNHINQFDFPTPEAFFSDCYKQYRHAIYTYLLDLAADSNLANDLTQNVFLKFWTLKDQYPMIGNTKAYLKWMAENAFRDTTRQDKTRGAYINAVSYSCDLSQPLTETMFAERELERNFQQAILDLSKQRRIVFVLSQIEGWPREKIVGTLGISPFTVKITLQNALWEVRKKCGLPHQFSINKNKKNEEINLMPALVEPALSTNRSKQYFHTVHGYEGRNWRY